MSDPTLHLFDDGRARAWEPFALTRPVGEVLFGCLTLRGRAERFWGLSCSGHLAGDGMVGFQEEDSPPGVGSDHPDQARTRVLFLSRAVPDLGRPPPEADENGPLVLVMDGSVVGWILPPGSPLPSPEALARPDTHPLEEARTATIAGQVLEAPWDLMAANPERITEDVAALFPSDDAFLSRGVERLGGNAVSLARKVAIEHGVILDVREGPIRLEEGVRVEAPGRLIGPLYLGRDTVVLGGRVGGLSAGPVCKLRGEIDSSVILGYTNKAHDGYLGHAILGRWVNLGAFTTNSDLKNDYGPVRVRTGGERVDTGLMKIGVFLGDHVKTAIGTLLNTGVMVGAGSNVFGGGLVAGSLPPFTWGSDPEGAAYRLERFLDVAERVMGRRDVELDPGMREVLSRAWRLARGGPA